MSFFDNKDPFSTDLSEFVLLIKAEVDVVNYLINNNVFKKSPDGIVASLNQADYDKVIRQSSIKIERKYNMLRDKNKLNNDIVDLYGVYCDYIESIVKEKLLWKSFYLIHIEKARSFIDSYLSIINE